MSREHTYIPSSWEATTRQIKEHFEIECLTEESASVIMRLYLKGTPTEQVIKQLEGEKK